MSTSHAEAVRDALRIIEEAQHLINLAAQKLCPVPGFADEWSASHAVYDTVKDYWYTVRSRQQHFDGLSQEAAAAARKAVR